MMKWFRWYNSFLSRSQESRQSPELDTLFESAKTQFNQAIDRHEQEWSLSRYRWKFEPSSGLLIFTHNKGTLPTLQAEAQVLGSLFHHTKRWEWAWNTPHIPKQYSKDARRLRRFGRQEGQVPLYTSPVDIHSQIRSPLHLAALGLYISNADSVYRGTSDAQDVFFFDSRFKTSRATSNLRLVTGFRLKGFELSIVSSGTDMTDFHWLAVMIKFNATYTRVIH